MNTYYKGIFTFLLVGVVVGGMYLQNSNPALFKGFIGQKSLNDSENVQTALADLKASVDVIAPTIGDEDMKINASIENVGEGAIQQGQPFKYSIFVNDVEVFTNTDSYTSMEPGDSFSFEYPVPKSIYQYPPEGSVRFVIDPENNISESNEENNEAVSAYLY
ncbi:hypothetical protein COU74_03200 [Candidatus Peregrinibacteria bacterium CG10_big_fil_rev_8_21_14_0_10_36_19]|nr:MAG: hypothetical protein COU74_03200 [Candidatus Peregrinibacteria bacterium CG10_big_fil_rev_8_21_14_0_10_36_19]